MGVHNELSSLSKKLYTIIVISLILLVCLQPIVYASDDYLEDLTTGITVQNTPSEQEMYDNIAKQQYVSTIFQANIDAYMLYPSNNDFANGVISSATNLLNWSRKKHSAGEFEEAIPRYDLILSRSTEVQILNDIAKTTQRLRDLANIRVMPTAKEQYDRAESRVYVSTIFTEHLKGVRAFPDDMLARTGLEKSTIKLLKWCHWKHTGGYIQEAILRYDLILNSPEVPAYLMEATKVSKAAADKGEIIKSANEMYAYAQSQQYVSTIFSAYVDGYKLYPYDSRFVKGVEKSTTNLFNWSQKKHRLGSFDEAIPRYDLILRKSGEVKINDDIANTVKRLKQLAALNVMPTAKEQYERAEGSIYVSTIFSEYLKGYRAFPGDPLFKEGLEKSTIKLLKWCHWKHTGGYIQEAILRYDLILNSPEVPAYLMEATKVSKAAADKGEIIKSANEMYVYALEQKYVSTIFSAYVDGYKLYSYDNRFVEGLDKSVTNLYNWSRRKHDEGKYQDAIIRYEMILKAPGIKNSLREQTIASLDSAQRALEQNKLTFTQYNETFASVLSKQMSKNPQTDLYGGGWTSARQGEVSYHLDPTNFIHPQYTEGGVTNPKWVEVTASSLNVRTGPSTSYASIRQVTKGNVYMYTEVKDGWYKIWVNDRFGWVSGDYVKAASSGTSTVDRLPKAMLQFLSLSGSCGVSASDINNELAGKGILAGKGQAFLQAGQSYNVNEIYLLSHALLETGNGRSELANGVLVSYVDGVPVEPKVVYNMYGIGAMDRDPIRLGSEYAYKQGWFTPEDAIIGGASWIEDGYINNSSYQQDTLYKMRWNPANPGAHQYATDIGWALKQTANMDLVIDIYSRHNIQMQFDIPVYK